MVLLVLVLVVLALALVVVFENRYRSVDGFVVLFKSMVEIESDANEVDNDVGVVVSSFFVVVVVVVVESIFGFVKGNVATMVLLLSGVLFVVGNIRIGSTLRDVFSLCSNCSTLTRSIDISSISVE